MDTALVLFSGGQDSTTCLAWALDRYERVETVGFDYGQRHAVELACRAPIRTALAGRNPGRLGPDHMIDLRAGMAALGQTAMTAEIAIEMTAENLPSTFVPGRNLLFLVYAGALAYRRGLRRIVGGMCETDFSGYPDCRDDTVKAMQVALNLGLERRLILETPLMWLDKAATWAMADAMGIVPLVVEQTHTCYRGDRTHGHKWGLAAATARPATCGPTVSGHGRHKRRIGLPPRVGRTNADTYRRDQRVGLRLLATIKASSPLCKKGPKNFCLFSSRQPLPRY